VRRGKAAIFSGCEIHPVSVAPAGSHRSGRGGDKASEASGAKGRPGRLSDQTDRNVSERRAGLETRDVEADLTLKQGRPLSFGKRATGTERFYRGIGVGMFGRGNRQQHGKPVWVRRREPQRMLREEPNSASAGGGEARSTAEAG
jgi:hypothetical protein